MHSVIFCANTGIPDVKTAHSHKHKAKGRIAFLKLMFENTSLKDLQKRQDMHLMLLSLRGSAL